MSRIETIDAWELVVPGDDAEPAAEFRRHGVRPGQRVRVAAKAENGRRDAAGRTPGFFASFDGPSDLAERSGDILRAEFPGAR